METGNGATSFDSYTGEHGQVKQISCRIEATQRPRCTNFEVHEAKPWLRRRRCLESYLRRARYCTLLPEEPAENQKLENAFCHYRERVLQKPDRHIGTGASEGSSWPGLQRPQRPRPDEGSRLQEGVHPHGHSAAGVSGVISVAHRRR